MSRRRRKLVFRRAAPFGAGRRTPPATDKLALFGWMRGTVVTMGDPTEPADPQWAKRIDDEYPHVA